MAASQTSNFQALHWFFWSLLVVPSVSTNLDELLYYETVEPVQLGAHVRSRRDLSTKTWGDHVESTIFHVHGHGREFRMLLQKNRFLMSSAFQVIEQNLDGSHAFTNGVEHCYYHGALEDRKRSRVAINTCHGLQGVIEDDDGEEFFIEPVGRHVNSTEGINSDSRHIIFNMKDKRPTRNATTCGSHQKVMGNFETGEHFWPQLRHRRANDLTGSTMLTNQLKYAEVAVVCDHRQFVYMGRSVAQTVNRALEMLNYVDSVYKTINLRVAVRAVVVMSRGDFLHVTTSGSGTLSQLRVYNTEVLNKRLKLGHDNAQLITHIDFEGTLVGLAPIGSFCTDGSVAINQDHDSNPYRSAGTIAHEMGHNLGMSHHDEIEYCVCEQQHQPCTMGSYAASTPVKGFANCSRDSFNKYVESGQFPCLFDYPDVLFGPAKCGNEFVEDGEQCDCGTPQECARSGLDKCCNSTTCRLHKTAVCSNGPCCNSDCTFKRQGTPCRNSLTECDLPEFCSGDSGECPRNYHINDGAPCSNNEAYCYDGGCRTHSSQCKTLFGPNAVKANDVCYERINVVGDKWGNCGTNLRQEPVACPLKNVFCGKLHCDGEGIPKLPIMGSGKSGKEVFYTSGSTSIRCLIGITSLGSDLDDPTIALDGTKCGVGKICSHKECLNVTEIGSYVACKTPCLNGGICNNFGHCHCPVGFSCPDCRHAGPGGSLDSGQGCIELIDTSCLSDVTKALLILFLLVVPLLILLGYLLYRYRASLRNRLRPHKQSGSRSEVARGRTGSYSRRVPTSESPPVAPSTGISPPFVTFAETSHSAHGPPTRATPATVLTSAAVWSTPPVHASAMKPLPPAKPPAPPPVQGKPSVGGTEHSSGKRVPPPPPKTRI